MFISMITRVFGAVGTINYWVGDMLAATQLREILTA